jgi:hypothetical protein
MRKKEKKYIIGFSVFILFCMFAIQALAASCSGTCYPIVCPEGTSESSGTCSDQYKCCSGSATNYGNSGSSVPAGTFGSSVNTQTSGASSVSGYSGFGSSGGVILPTWSGLPQGTVEGVVFAALMWLLSIFGFIAVISFIVSGVQYFLAFGEEKSMENAKNNMKYSIIGVVVGLMGVIIIYAVDALLRGMPMF